MTDKLLPISSAREASKRLGLRTMIVLQELPDGTWGYTSYGKTKADCGRARRIADYLFRGLHNAIQRADHDA